ALLCGIRGMGIPASMGGSDEGLREAYSSAGGIVCFSRSVRSEIHVDGKKLVGSAQRRIGGVILQHGSFLLGRQHRRIVEFINGGAGGKLLAGLEAGTTEAETILGRPVPFGEAAASIAAPFVARFQSTGAPAPGGESAAPGKSMSFQES
ncbi:MAG TPA: hypothetical protein VJO14_04130, partial [Bacteroidota bacterium]|nr:hypothetical protein [Bacteroidota bacterium]